MIVSALVMCWGIDGDVLPWGNYMESEPADKVGDYYVDGGWWVKGYMVESPELDDILRYGTFVADDELYAGNYKWADDIRIRLISYNGELYYHKMRDGDVVECRKVGRADA